MDPNQPYPLYVAAPVPTPAGGHLYYGAPAAPAPLITYQGAPVPHLTAQQYPPQVLRPTAVHQPIPYGPEARRDLWPARLLCGGIGIGAAGTGLAFLLQAIAAATTGLGLITAALALGWLLKNQSSTSSSGRGAVNVHVNVTSRNR
ncbi:hypothetical protein [Kitasatospora sp. NPDC002040]|uniref:hypothetical protein n=1 Tax=Kitasatospora sp. NPDC002040 TaxID=3154661 RepID=UPI0033249379